MLNEAPFLNDEYSKTSCLQHVQVGYKSHKGESSWTQYNRLSCEPIYVFENLMQNTLSAQVNSNAQRFNVRQFYQLPNTSDHFLLSCCQFTSHSYIDSHPKQKEPMHNQSMIWNATQDLHIHQETHGQKAKSHGFYGQSSSINQLLVTDEPVEFEEWLVEVQDFRKSTDHFRGIYRIYLKLVKKNWTMSTCNQLNLKTLGSQPVVLKILPEHCSRCKSSLILVDMDLNELVELLKETIKIKGLAARVDHFRSSDHQAPTSWAKPFKNMMIC